MTVLTGRSAWRGAVLRWGPVAGPEAERSAPLEESAAVDVGADAEEDENVPEFAEVSERCDGAAESGRDVAPVPRDEPVGYWGCKSGDGNVPNAADDEDAEEDPSVTTLGANNRWSSPAVEEPSTRAAWEAVVDRGAGRRCDGRPGVCVTPSEAVVVIVVVVSSLRMRSRGRREDASVLEATIARRPAARSSERTTGPVCESRAATVPTELRAESIVLRLGLRLRLRLCGALCSLEL